MTSEQQAEKRTEKSIKLPADKLYQLQDELRGDKEGQGNPPWDLIFKFTDGQIGDIVEVFWSNEDPVQISASASLHFAFLERVSASDNIPRLFNSIPTHPSPLPFNSDKYILYFSPMMTPEEIGQFIARISDQERGLIQRLAINHRKFEKLDRNLLTEFNALKELIIVSEIQTEEHPALGPTAEPPEKVVFFVAESEKLRSEQAWDSNDLRFQTESELGKIRDQKRAWPVKPVQVNVAITMRDGRWTKTEFQSNLHKNLSTKKKDEEDAAARRAAEAKERAEDAEYIESLDSDSSESEAYESDAGGSIVVESVQAGKLTSSLKSLSLQHHGPFSSTASTADDMEVTPEDMAAMDESDRRATERYGRKEEDEQVEAALAQLEGEVKDFDEEVDDEDVGSEDEDDRADEADAVED